MINTVEDLINELQQLPKDALITIYDTKRDLDVHVTVIDYTGDGDYTLEPDD